MTDEELKWNRVTTAAMVVLKYSLLRLLGRGVIVALYHVPAAHHLIVKFYDLNMLLHHPHFMAMFFLVSTFEILELAISMALGRQGKKEKGKREILLKAADVFFGGNTVYCAFSVLFPKFFVLPDYDGVAIVVVLTAGSLFALLQIILMIKKWKPGDVSLEQSYDVKVLM